MESHADDVTTQQDVFGAKGPGGVTARLRLFFLAPLAGVITVITGLLIYELYAHEREEVRREVGRIQVALGKMYKDDLAHDINMLRAAMEVLRHMPPLREALANKDRARLLALTAPVFAKLREQHGITHFYFINPDRTMLLRVYRPESYGDAVKRFVPLEAERTGRAFHGVELGKHGTFTLRLVEPWYAPGSRRPIGYVELGMEIDRVLQGTQSFLDAQVFMLISKEFLRRDDWEAGMKILGRASEWDRFPDVVLSTQAAQALPPAVAVKFVEGQPLATGTVLEAVQDRTAYRLALSPLRDAAGRTVGQMAVLIDVTHQITAAHRALWLGATLVLGAGGTLFAFFYWFVGRVGRRIEHDERKLEELATHDGLTGLYNHRTFHALLADEMVRTDRFGRQLSLLMLDIDHFKRVNDTHGHQAGDAILRGLSALLERQARAIDHVCRYGGEEITVILPETDTAAAMNIAERLRAAIERQPFDIGGGKTVGITVSIGVATYPQQVDALEKLVKAADTAMYAAKQGGRNRAARYEPAMKGADAPA